MTVIVLIPGLLTALLAFFKGWRVALVYGFLPTLIFFPNFYMFKVNGVPELSFWSGSMLAVFSFWVFDRGWRGLRFEIMDAVVVAYCLWCVVAENNSNGPKEAQNLIGKLALGALMPYALARSLRQDAELIWNVVRVLAVCAALLFVLAPYEARMGRNPFDFWRSIMPTTDWDGALYRNGVRRVAGSFSHSICYGYFGMMVLPLAIWLHVTRSFRERWMSWAVMALCVIGMGLSGSRGAGMGAVIAVVSMLLLWNPNRKVWIPVTFGFVAIGLLLVYPAINELMQMNRNDGDSESAQTAAYRAAMIREYLQICNKSPWLGYGRANLPVIENMKSIDNQYLLLSLNYGYPSAVLLGLTGILGVAVQLPSVLVRPAEGIWSRLDAALAAILLGAIGVQATVFAGTQTEQLYFMFVGLAASPMAIGMKIHHMENTNAVPPASSGALVPRSRMAKAANWWREMMLTRAKHVPLSPELQAQISAAASGGVEVSQGKPTRAIFSVSCDNCVQYPPRQNVWWIWRLYRWLLRREPLHAKLKPHCRECGLYRERIEEIVDGSKRPLI